MNIMWQCHIYVLHFIYGDSMLYEAWTFWRSSLTFVFFRKFGSGIDGLSNTFITIIVAVYCLVLYVVFVFPDNLSLKFIIACILMFSTISPLENDRFFEGIYILTFLDISLFTFLFTFGFYQNSVVLVLPFPERNDESLFYYFISFYFCSKKNIESITKSKSVGKQLLFKTCYLYFK
jgi:hypothetical protein